MAHSLGARPSLQTPIDILLEHRISRCPGISVGETLRRIRPWCKHFQRNDMPEEHRCDAKLALILEAPGLHEDEDEWGRPIVGPSGWDLSQWWKQVGLARADFYIDNTYPFRPPNNRLEAVPELERVEHAAACVHRLRRQDPNVVVVAGNYALRAVLGDRHMAISDWRGSVLPWNNRKLVPTLHPAVTQRQRVLTKLCRADWARIASEAKERSYTPTERRLVIDPSVEEMKEWEAAAQDYFSRPYLRASPPRVLSVDVENRRDGNRELYCVGLSFDPKWAITVSTVRRDFSSENMFESATAWVRHIITIGYPIVGQNFQTDLYKLAMWRPELRVCLQQAYIWDLIEMGHLLDPNDGGDTKEGSEDESDSDGGLRVGMLDLGTLYSLFGKCPVYYKHLSSSPNWETRAQYNALDAAVQREIFDPMWEQLFERGLV